MSASRDAVDWDAWIQEIRGFYREMAWTPRRPVKAPPSHQEARSTLGRTDSLGEPIAPPEGSHEFNLCP